MGLGAAVVVLILLFCTDWLRGDTTKSRWKDPFWIGWAFMVCYMLHNVEEYGFDLTGAHNARPSRSPCPHRLRRMEDTPRKIIRLQITSEKMTIDTTNMISPYFN